MHIVQLLLLDFWTLSIIQYSEIKDNFSGAGSASVLREGVWTQLIDLDRCF
jgi:hypothetical protein